MSQQGQIINERLRSTMAIEAVYFDGDQRYSISIPQSLIPLNKPVRERSHKIGYKRVTCLILLGTTVLYQIISLCSKGVASKAIRGLSKRQELSQNARKVKFWRSKVLDECASAKTEEDMADILKLARDEAFPFSSYGLEQKIIDPDYLPGNHIERCPYVMIDLGSGVGNSVTDFIDSGLVGCEPRKQLENIGTQRFDPLHFHADGKLRYLVEIGKDESNEEFKRWVNDKIQNFDTSLGPEDYCVYGVEGNPLLKHKLKTLENNVARMDPSPLQHLHFLTRTVAGGDHRQSIFIDHAHERENSPGSSLFFNHENLRESRDTYGDIVEYKVDTTSISTLMEQTLSRYHDRSDSTQMTRNHLIIHIDVEGSEFDILNEAKNSGLLCNFALEGNYVDIFVQYHSPEFLGIETAAMLQYIHEIRPYFESQCGDTLKMYERNLYFLPPGSR